MGTSARERGDTDRSTLFRLLAAVPGAALRAFVARMPESLWRFLLGLCGAVLLIAPLLLWVAWSRSGYLAILACAAVAMAVACLLVRHAPEHRRL